MNKPEQCGLVVIGAMAGNCAPTMKISAFLNRILLGITMLSMNLSSLKKSLVLLFSWSWRPYCHHILFLFFLIVLSVVIVDIVIVVFLVGGKSLCHFKLILGHWVILLP